MSYRVEKYKDCKRFNEQYQELYRFLLRAEKLECNEHFHWGRFEWMQAHSQLDIDKLSSILIFRDSGDEIVGLISYDTKYDDRTYIIHTLSDKALLSEMIDAVCHREDGKAVIKANSKDLALCEVLREKEFERTCRDSTVLSLDLSNHLYYSVSDAYSISKPGFDIDNWQYQLVIHRGFNHEDIPEKWPDELLKPTLNENLNLKVFAIKECEYCAHCGLWYTEGDTAYVEPVVTVPEHRKLGLARAVIYEACNRARKLGAKRATVLSGQAFYYRIGFVCSSEVYRWEKQV